MFSLPRWWWWQMGRAELLELTGLAGGRNFGNVVYFAKHTIVYCVHLFKYMALG